MAQAMYTASKEGLERRTNQQQFAQQEEEEKRDAIAAAGLQDAAVGVEIITSEAEPTRPASDEAQPGSSRQDAPPSDLTPVAAPMSSISPYATRGRDHFQGSIVAVGTCYDSATTQNGHQYPHLLLADSSADGAIHSLALSVSANRLATAHDEQAPRIWDLTTGALLFRLEGHSDSVYTVVFSPDGTKLVSGSADHNAILWDLASHESIAVLTGHKGDVWITAYSPDGAYIATSATDGVVRLWDGEDGRPLVTLPAHPTTVMALKFSPDSKRLVTCADSVGYVWDVATQKQLASMTGHKGMIWSIDFARDEGEQRIVTAAEDGIVYVWSAEDGRVLVTLCEHEGPVWAAVFSPDGGEVTSGGYDGRVVTCDSYLGERKHLLAGDKWIDQIQVAGGDSEELIQSAGRRQGVVNVVAYSADGEMVAAGCADGTVKVWEVGIAAEKSGRFVAEFAGHTDKVTSIVWTPDDESVVSASDDGTIRLWSVVDQMRFGG
ncbi:WD40 repeat-like protein [Trametopsis cervina]|nr:WD40 repeat-like protein [Trametopsis cervina]